MPRSRRRGRTGTSMVVHTIHNDAHKHRWGTRHITAYVTSSEGERYIQHSTMQVCRCGATQSPVNTKRTALPPTG